MAILTGLIILSNQEFTQALFIDVLILVIAISVSAFPEGFPVVLITTLSVGAYKMAKKNAIVNRMSIIETLGETTVICSDKTGTITKGEMTAKKIYCQGNLYDISGIGFESGGDFSLSNKKIKISDDKNLKLLMQTAALCNDAIIKKVEDDNCYHINGMPTEAALLIMAAKANIFREDFSGERTEEITFSSERKMMSVLFKDKKNYSVFSKGALEILLKKCSRIQKKAGIRKIVKNDIEKIMTEYEKMTSAAFRTIALAYKNTKITRKDDLEKDLIFLGLIGIEDPPRTEVKNSIAVCKKAGIDVKMITGDNKKTAISVAEQISLKKGKVIEGEEMDKLTDDELARIVKDISVFARVRPEHKIRIVRALKEKGEIVTMTGDGVNDSPALKEAHIGVAMGKAGTDVSRSVADLILKDDNFSTIVDAISEGRAIFNNIQKFTSYQLSCNYAELAIIFIGVLLAPVLGWPVPILLALHILFMNLITDNLPAITLGFNNGSPDIMEKPPRKNATILNKNTIIPLIISSFIMTVFALMAFYIAYNLLELSIEQSRTLALLVLILLEIVGAFSFRSFRKVVIGRSLFVNKYLVYASAASLLATIAIIYTPLSAPFETAPLSLAAWSGAAAAALLAVLIVDIIKKINNKKKYLIFE
jgi:P-type Ca2+ transporter type 2C